MATRMIAPIRLNITFSFTAVPILSTTLRD